MGGRGRRSGRGVRQYTFNEEKKRLEISNVREKSAKARANFLGGNGGNRRTSQQLKEKCACCGEYTISAGSEFETCSNCGWIDDHFQNSHPESTEGRNPISLMQARTEYFNKNNE
jgi:rRNA maturation protein Nop10